MEPGVHRRRAARPSGQHLASGAMGGISLLKNRLHRRRFIRPEVDEKTLVHPRLLQRGVLARDRVGTRMEGIQKKDCGRQKVEDQATLEDFELLTIENPWKF